MTSFIANIILILMVFQAQYTEIRIVDEYKNPIEGVYVKQKNNFWYSDKNGVVKKTFKIENLAERYFNKDFRSDSQFTPISEDGNIVIKKDGKIEYLVKSSKIKKDICGYYAPDISPDSKYLVCIYECSRYNGKKIVGNIHLIEMNILDRKVKDLEIIGSEPKYSKSGQYILFRSKDGYSIINKTDNYSVLHLPNIVEAYWIDNIK